MSQDPKMSFSPQITEKLKYYVYRLIDPRNGETFYVGKGLGNRVFQHCADELASEADELKDKLKRIREIKLAQFDVEHVIHRHGMDSDTAFEVEGALIDAYPGLTNQADGNGNQDRGVMHSRQIIAQYTAAEAQFQHRALLINVNLTATTLGLYDATRHAWKIDPVKARKAEVILATRFGLIVGAFIADQWLEATKENFPGFPERPGRWGFCGREAPRHFSELYVGKRVPEEMRKKGSANPIRYTPLLESPIAIDGSPSIESEIEKLENRFHALIQSRLEAFNLPIPNDLPHLEGLKATKKKPAAFDVDGMYGGFYFYLQHPKGQVSLVVESWSRVCGGSGQRHIITPICTELVEEGFV